MAMLARLIALAFGLGALSLPPGMAVAAEPMTALEMAMLPASATAFIHCRILTSPDAEPIVDGTLVMLRDRITAVGPASTGWPPHTRRIDCKGATLMAGFWNSHVHLLGPQFQDAAGRPAAELSGALDAMLLRHGFVHVVDTGSDLVNTGALARRIDALEVRGPSIISTGMPMVTRGGTPFYVEGLGLPVFPEIADAADAKARVEALIDGGAGAIKLMTVSLTRKAPFPELPLAVVKAATAAAHARGLKVIAHPTDQHGAEVALDGGIDVLAHTAPIGGPWSPDFAGRMATAGMALIPTLKLWRYEAARQADAKIGDTMTVTAEGQVRAFRAAGGRVLFGTDVGYMQDDDPTDEYAAMARAGMGWRDILAALTTTPVQTFTPQARRGRLAVGYAADLVLLSADPTADPTAFAKVAGAWRDGRPVYPASKADQSY